MRGNMAPRAQRRERALRDKRVILTVPHTHDKGKSVASVGVTDGRGFYRLHQLSR
jgi:hypothetical protein